LFKEAKKRIGRTGEAFRQYVNKRERREEWESNKKIRRYLIQRIIKVFPKSYELIELIKNQREYFARNDGEAGIEANRIITDKVTVGTGRFEKAYELRKKLFQDYFNAIEEGLPTHGLAISRRTGIAAMCISRIIRKSKYDFEKARPGRTLSNEEIAFRDARISTAYCSTDLDCPEIGYFEGLRPANINRIVRKEGQISNKGRKNCFAFAVHINYEIASRIYEASDMLTDLDEEVTIGNIVELDSGLKEKPIGLYLENRHKGKMLEGKIVDGLRILKSDDSINKPYL